MESIELKEIINAEPQAVYAAWLSSEGHSKMTGAEAVCSSEVGGTFEAWDGYIQGSNLELVSNRKIVQSWRTVEFDESNADSELIIQLKPINKGTELILTHKNIPKGQTQYKQGWIEHYFEPMKRYFENLKID